MSKNFATLRPRPLSLSRRSILGAFGLTMIPALSPRTALADVVAPSAEAEVTKADAIRNPGVPFRMTNTIVDYRAGVTQSQVVLETFGKVMASTGEFASIVRYLEPEQDTGKLFLKNGNDMWFYDENSKSTTRIAPQQRLVGQASIGDVISVNYARDYHAASIGEDAILDAAHAERDCWRLEMVAAAPDATYARVLYWVERETSRPVKARYFSDSGRELKVIFYKDYAPMLGATRAGTAIIIDAVDTRLATIMRFSDAIARDVPDQWFERDFLARLADQ
ncbi:outer membrane lipoprotein-sorting protein [Nguyenibacter vanlangensis]|uniref:Outer membrane lipoprotein-sorting protein n=1 Tax=Nguyenibacter vanlangensis TaxID=1216886 RepID=A0A7Y7M5M7_9PROT|nr:outer membrane lipoprotein-sorting protein [Nguyenibacter vanlangensis]NVN09776.1 outer membrane lipoprotein-sorting protein [Nguyenibacter vanlangensis]